MLNALIKKIGFGLLYLIGAVLLIKFISPLNDAIFSMGSWLFFKLGPGGLEWISSDYEWGEDPATFAIAVVSVIAIAWLVARIVRRLAGSIRK